MQFGFGAPVSGPLSGPRDLARIASEGEAIGYDYCTIIGPCRDPARIGGEVPLFRHRRVPRPGRRRPPRAADLRRLRRGQDLEIASCHLGDGGAAPAAGADRQGHLDDRRACRKGRFTWGIGVGWCKEEFEAIGTEPFEERGAVTDETIAVCRELWTNENPSFKRQIRRVLQHLLPAAAGAEAHPGLGRRRERPGDAPHRPARRRLVPDRHQSRGTGSTRWAPQRAVEQAARAGAGGRPQRRTTSSSPIASRNSAKAFRSAPITATAGSAPATTPRSSSDLRALRELGVIAVDFSFGGNTAEAVIANMRRFREDVLAKV